MLEIKRRITTVQQWFGDTEGRPDFCQRDICLGPSAAGTPGTGQRNLEVLWPLSVSHGTMVSPCRWWCSAAIVSDWFVDVESWL